MADEAITNANLEHADHLPTPPDVIVINNEDDDPLPLYMQQPPAILPKIKPESSSTPMSPPSHCYPTRLCNPPKHLENFHLFTTVAEDTRTSYPYIDASGNTVDLAILDKNTIVQVCRYVMLHCADSICLGNPNNKKQYGLKARASVNLLTVGMQLL